MHRSVNHGCKQRAYAALLALALAFCLPSLHAEACATRSAATSTVSAKSLKIPAKAWEHFHKARLAAEQHKDADFERESARALADAPEFAQMYLLRAAKQVGAREYTEAIASIAEARRIEPDAAWAGTLLAGAYNGMRQYDQAAAAITALHGPAATTWQAMHEMARAQVGLRHVDEALHWSELAMAAAPAECTGTRLVRANALLVAERWGESADQLRSYLALSPSGSLRETVQATLLRLEQRIRVEKVRTAMLQQNCSGSLSAAGECAVAQESAGQSEAMLAQSDGSPIH